MLERIGGRCGSIGIGGRRRVGGGSSGLRGVGSGYNSCGGSSGSSNDSGHMMIPVGSVYEVPPNYDADGNWTDEEENKAYNGHNNSDDHYRCVCCERKKKNC